MRPLAPSDREALALRWARLRTAASRAESASAAWNKLNDELMAKWRAERLDDLAISKVKAANLALNDAYGLYSFYKGEVERYSADICAELAYRQMLAMGDDDPTGLRYSREDDEEPVAAPTREHDGFHITGRNQRPTKQPTAVPGGSPVGMGTAGLRGPAVPTLRGGAR